MIKFNFTVRRLIREDKLLKKLPGNEVCKPNEEVSEMVAADFSL